VTASLQLTYGGVFVAVFAQQLGLPIPSVAFLMAAGALSAQGGMHAGILVLLGILACLAGDGVWFWIGRKWGSKAVALLCRFTADPRSCSRSAQEKFRRYGLRLLCVAKFVPGLDAVMPPLGGAEGVPLAAFLALDLVGSFSWSSAYVGLGYLFSGELEAAFRWVQRFGMVFWIAIGVTAGLYVCWRGLTLVRMILQLRQRRITPPMLTRILKSDNKVAVLDLLKFEEHDDNEAIPGAFVVNPSLLRKSPPLAVPDDLKIILYSASGNHVVSARAAVALKRIGVGRVWWLEGGLKAWRAQGFPVSQSPEAPEVVAERLGVKLPAL
jgi:membrane protein DedA with SNARE-associated domain/rhodanese-related sulfurtransferase